MIVSGFAILSSTIHHQNNGSPARGTSELISRVVYELEMTGSSSVNLFRTVAEAIVHIEELTASDLEISVANSEPNSSLYDVDTPISPTSLQNLEMQSMREVTPLTECITAAVNSQVKTLSAASLSSNRRADGHTSPRTTPPNTPRRSSSVITTIPQDTDRRIQTMDIRSSDSSTINMSRIGCVHDTTQNTGPTFTKRHDISEGSAGDNEWDIAFMDAAQVPNTYSGDVDHIHLQSAVTPSAAAVTAAATTALTQAPNTWGYPSGYITHNIYHSTSRMHHYCDTLVPEQMSSLGEECFGNVSEGLNQPQFSPSDLSDWQLWMDSCDSV